MWAVKIALWDRWTVPLILQNAKKTSRIRKKARISWRVEVLTWKRRRAPGWGILWLRTPQTGRPGQPWRPSSPRHPAPVYWYVSHFTPIYLKIKYKKLIGCGPTIGDTAKIPGLQTMFLGLPDPHSDPLVTSTDPAGSGFFHHQAKILRTTLISFYCFLLLYDF